MTTWFSRTRAAARGGLFLATALGAASPAQAASDVPAALLERVGEVQRALPDDRAFEHVASLTTEVGPRLAGSAGDSRAVAWALARLRDLGFENVRAEPVTVPRWVRGEAHAEIVSPWPQPLVLAALGGSVGTPEGGLEADVVEAANVAAFEALPADRVRGRIVFLSERMERASDGSGYGKTVQIRGNGAVAAARRGALAVVIRSVGTDSHRLSHTGGMHYEEGVPRIPGAALAQPDADLLAAQVASGHPVRMRLRLGCRDAGSAESANVIGEVVGRESPEEIVVLGAHLDSWDLGTGALDDGAGVAIVLEAARRIAHLAQRPRRTVRVVLFANEEFGLSGGKAYVAQHAEELPRHVAALESDLGTGRITRFRARVAARDEPQLPELARVLASLGIAFDAAPARGGSDIGPLGEAGVPLFDLPPDATTYFDFHHTADDTLDKVDRDGLAAAVAANGALALVLADLPGRLATLPPAP